MTHMSKSSTLTTNGFRCLDFELDFFHYGHYKETCTGSSLVLPHFFTHIPCRVGISLECYWYWYNRYRSSITDILTDIDITYRWSDLYSTHWSSANINGWHLLVISADTSMPTRYNVIPKDVKFNEDLYYKLVNQTQKAGSESSLVQSPKPESKFGPLIMATLKNNPFHIVCLVVTWTAQFKPPVQVSQQHCNAKVLLLNPWIIIICFERKLKW